MQIQNFLPKGFSYLNGDEVKEKINILNLFVSEAKHLFNNLVEFPPVAFSDTFKKGANITGEKTYEFKDKKNRDLILTPDSQAHIFNYYLSGNNVHKNVRYSFISPIFRYRNLPNRHFYQIGFASVNHPIENEIIELYLCTRQLIRFIKNVISSKIYISIVNPYLSYEILSYLFSNNKERINLFYDKLRICKSITDIQSLIKSLPQSIHTDQLKNIFFEKPFDLRKTDLFDKYFEGLKTKQLITLLSEIEGLEIKLTLENLYCSEILSGAGFILSTDAEKIADGGIYNIFGSRFNSNIQTTISVCTGINPLYRSIKRELEKKEISIFLKNYERNIHYTLLIADIFSKEGYRIDIQPLRKSNKQYVDGRNWLIFIDEINSNFSTGRVSNQSMDYFQTFQNFTFEKLITLILNMDKAAKP